MKMRLKRLLSHVCTPDELDMIEHYLSPAEKTADLIVHVVGLTLAVVTGGVWVAQGFVAKRLAPGVMDPQGFGELLTPIFSVLIVFVLAEVFREGARLRRESELTI